MGSLSQPSTSSSQSRGHGQSRNRPRPNLSNQDQLAKLALKTEYMDLLDEINAVDAGLSVRQSIAQITDVVQKADKLFSRVTDTSEMFLDAMVMHSTSTALEAATSNIDLGEGTFKLLLFADQFKIKATTGGAEAPLEALLSVAQPVVCNSLPHWSPLLGSFEFTATSSSTPVKKSRQVRQRDVETAKKEPEKVIKQDKSEKRAEEIVRTIFSKLKKYYKQSKQEPINYFRFVLNPTSFAATVENIFYVSFLVNDGNVTLEIENDELFISPNVSGKENSNPQCQQQQSQPQSREKKQNIVSIDMTTWRELIAGLQIKEAMI